MPNISNVAKSKWQTKVIILSSLSYSLVELTEGCRQQVTFDVSQTLVLAATWNS